MGTEGKRRAFCFEKCLLWSKCSSARSNCHKVRAWLPLTMELRAEFSAIAPHSHQHTALRHGCAGLAPGGVWLFLLHSLCYCPLSFFAFFPPPWFLTILLLMHSKGSCASRLEHLCSLVRNRALTGSWANWRNFKGCQQHLNESYFFIR